MTSPKIITRFAPSPTGFLHIGGARTALFNYYFAKSVGGEFHLRIEDTDKARSTPEATQAILDGLSWLGLSYDGDIVYQSKNAKNHVQAAHALLEAGKAYRCYCTPEELERLRENRSDGAFRSPYRDQVELEDKPFTVRFRVPDGQTSIKDHVQGEINWQNKDFDDLVLLRADGTPTYMLAVVVDDHNMGVTHVVRGDDHLINAGRQTQIYQALDWDIPQWAHVPLIHGPDGKKLSKRHGALGVEAYSDMGYLPEGMRNYLLKLGWAHGDSEIFFKETDITKLFSLDGINSAPARLDFDKMDFINAQHIAIADDNRLFDLSIPFLENANEGRLTSEQQDRVKAGMESLKTRAKTLTELSEQARYLSAQRPLNFSGKVLKVFKREGVLDLVQALTFDLESLEEASWTQDVIQRHLEAFTEQHNIGFGKIGQPVRAALTAGAPSPDLSLVISLLGKTETLGRLNDVLTTGFDKE